MELNSDWDVKILSELPDSDFDFPPFEFEDEDEEEGECTSSSEEEEDFGRNDICLDEALFPNLITQLASSSVKRSNSPPVSNQIEVLINVDNDHRKIITLKDGKDNLELAFAKAISSDPTLSEYIGVKVSFKVYNNKFHSWVDYDKTKELEDGMHLWAVFLKRFLPASSEPEEDDYIKSLNEYVQKRKSNKYENQQKRHSNKYQPYGVHCKRQRKNKNNPNSTVNMPSYAGIDSDSTHNHISGMLCKKIKEEKDYEPGGFEVEPTCSTLLEKAVLNNMKIHSFASETKENRNCLSQGAVYCLTLGLADKDPISALYELCAKLKLNPPKFELVHQVGAKNSVWMKVTVNDKVYCPALANSKFKDAKRAAAKLCLEELGILPKH